MRLGASPLDVTQWIRKPLAVSKVCSVAVAAAVHSAPNGSTPPSPAGGRARIARACRRSLPSSAGERQRQVPELLGRIGDGRVARRERLDGLGELGTRLRRSEHGLGRGILCARHVRKRQ